MLKGHPVYEGHFAQSQISVSYIIGPVLKGHISIEDTSLHSLWCMLSTGFTVVNNPPLRDQGPSAN